MDVLTIPLEVSAVFACFGWLSGRRFRGLCWILACGAALLPLPPLIKSLLLGGALCLSGKGSPAPALAAVAVFHLSYGSSNALASFLAPLLPHPEWLMIGGELLPLGIALLTCRATGRLPEGTGPILPLAFFALLGDYFCHTFYGNTVLLTPGQPDWIHLWMLGLQLLGLACVPALLGQWRRQEGCRLRLHAHEQYTAAVQARWQAAAALRHDLRHHLALTRSLLERGREDQARMYLAALGAEAEGLSPPYETGRPLLDVLLESKAAQAERLGIYLTADFRIPAECPVTDLDFSILLGNALDNAIHACADLEGNPQIRLTLRRQGTFLLLSVDNPCPSGTRIRPGMGLSSIRRTAKRYGGSVSIHAAGGTASLRILLNTSQHPSRIPHPFP